MSIKQDAAQVQSVHSTSLSFDNIDRTSIRVSNVSISVNKQSFKSRFSRNKNSSENGACDPDKTKVNTAITTTASSSSNNISPQQFQLQSQSPSPSQQKRSLLDSVSFDIPAGNILAIVGGSGSGKTTLLNTLAQRTSLNNSNLKQTGEILYNDSTNINNVNHAYVIQQDILIPTLTCYETLKYAANLRLLKTVTYENQEQLIDQIISELGLKDARDTLVGNREHKGLSGGEKRRLSIGIQMLSNPSLLFLDEPTTGLDAHSAFLLIKTLKNLAKKGRTFVLSVHQPRSDIFFLFDYLCILSRGCPVYCDQTAKVVDYFGNLGWHVPQNVNPADYLIDVTSVDTRDVESERKTVANFEFFRRNWRNYESQNILSKQALQPVVNTKTDNGNSNNQSVLKNSRAGLWDEVIILTKRELVLTSRDPLTTISLLCESLFLSIIVGWVFYKQPRTILGIRSKSASLYNINALQGYLMYLFETYRLCHRDIRIFDRERSENSVSVLGFLLSRRLSKLVTEDILVPTIFAIITYFMLDVKKTATAFFLYWTVNLYTHQLSMAFATLSVSITRDYPIASLIGNLNFTFQSYCCGFFVNLTTMPKYVRWIKYLCYVWYTYGLTVSIEFTGFFGDCPYSDDPSDPRCTSYTGKNILQTLGFWENWITVPACVALGFLLIFYSLTVMFFYLNKVDIAIAKQSNKKVSNDDETKKKEKDLKDNSDDADKQSIIDVEKVISSSALNGIDIFLKNISLNVKVVDISIKAFFFRLIHFNFHRTKKNIPAKQILSNVNATFQKHKINAIMGPSGSGKTTLLNLISGKLNSNFATEYDQSGTIYFNEYAVLNDLLSGICSYVLQDDDSLLPMLTVKETLMFAAKLRLSKTSMTSGEIEERVNSIILKLGLKDCQHNMIGSDLVKGISGGEKRRVSIGIQLLNDPQVIFLDEPTSGLDSFTASSILNILETLASAEKRTVVLTIHQPRYSIFKRFGQVLLLAKGGNVVFNGSPVEMANYFANMSYQCPPLTNFADYVLDLVSINMQNDEVELASRARADQLVQHWNEEQQTNSTFLTQTNHNSSIDANEVFGHFRKKPAPFAVAFPLILKRQGITVLRHRDVMFTRIFQASGTGIISALFYAPIKHDYIGITNMLGLVQQVSALYFVGMLNNIAVYPIERNFFYEEYGDHLYGLPSYFFAYLILEVPFEFIASCLYSIFTVLAVGLPRTGTVFFLFVYASFALVNCGESLGIMFNTAFMHTGFAINVISVFLCIAVIMSGLLSLQMPAFFRGINWISPVYYAVMGAINVVFENEDHFSCKPGGSGSTNGNKCLFNNGKEVLDGYNIKKNYKMLFGVLAAVTVAYRMIAYMALWVKLNNYNPKTLKKWVTIFSI